MKETDPIEENFIKEIMFKSKLELPFSDFEDNVMIQIEENILHQPAFSKDIKLSWIFFIVGSVFGIAISLILPMLHKSVLGIQPSTLALGFQIVFTILLLTQMDVLLKLIKKTDSKKTNLIRE
jgi:hypothetical protein